ncbi:MAG: UDP-N-acetylglucosamine 2-epimerase (non-hydrolyzing) [Calditrichaeota bacterium]|nr:MAG: UDP-N-acetylglucosamine 2-epimerase (non-hydrolyzing) [Calditrichota bacterium]
MIKIANVVGARPNFMKIAPIHRRMQQSPKISPILIHTGQHYDQKMSSAFFDDLGMPEPDIFLGVGSGSHAEQTASVLLKMEQFLLQHKVDLLIVVGDVNSTLAASLAAVKLSIPVAHVEAGLRSFDRSMPEEINRILTDKIADFLFVTEQSGLDNLRREGVADNKVFLVGNVMIDSLLDHLAKAEKLALWEEYKLKPQNYVLMTLHRPSNVDNAQNLSLIFSALEQIQSEMPVVFPMHPRTRKMLNVFGLENRLHQMTNIIVVEPLGYLPFLCLMSRAGIVLTDSGGIQEETTFLKIPCLTMRENTERPVTITLGTNRLVGMNPDEILHGFQVARNGSLKNSQIPPFWDGIASQRIVQIIETIA